MDNPYQPVASEPTRCRPYLVKPFLLAAVALLTWSLLVAWPLLHLIPFDWTAGSGSLPRRYAVFDFEIFGQPVSQSTFIFWSLMTSLLSLVASFLLFAKGMRNRAMNRSASRPAR